MSRANPRFHRTNASLPAIPLGSNVVCYKIIGAVENQLTVTTFYYMGGVGLPTALQLGTLMLNISAVLRVLYLNCIAADWTLTSERIDIVNVNTVQGQTSITNAGSVGTRVAPHLPTQMAAVILRQCNVKGQHGRGRISLPAISAGDCTESTITLAAEKTALTNLSNAFFTTATDGINVYIPVIAQRSPASPRLVTGASALTGARVNLLLGTIRRRKIGRGK